jgi:hypothetical protein
LLTPAPFPLLAWVKNSACAVLSCTYRRPYPRLWASCTSRRPQLPPLSPQLPTRRSLAPKDTLARLALFPASWILPVLSRRLSLNNGALSPKAKTAQACAGFWPTGRVLHFPGTRTSREQRYLTPPGGRPALGAPLALGRGPSWFSAASRGGPEAESRRHLFESSCVICGKQGILLSC